jgi:D-aminoacyl-tRNA deacylase
MRAVVQRVSSARVLVDHNVVGQIDRGMLVLLGVATGDTEQDALYLKEKILKLRIFDDEDGKMNLSLIDIAGEVLVVSQFTLYGDTRRGRRPSFIKAAPPTDADRLYRFFVSSVRSEISGVQTGTFQAMMDVELINDGPVTIMLDSEKTI